MDSLTKDRLVCGIPENILREKLLREDNLDLQKALTLCRAAETMKAQARELFSESNVQTVQKGKT